MNDDYSIYNLRKRFSAHAIEYHDNFSKDRKKFEENYPNEKLPYHLKNEFNLPLALSILCQEIEKINNELQEMRQASRTN